MPINLTLPIIREEEALSYITTYMRQRVSSNSSNDIQYSSQEKKYTLNVSEIIAAYLEELKQKNNRDQPQLGMASYSSNLLENSEPFYCAVANLCSRGILAPKPVFFNPSYTSALLIGGQFILTEYGVSWLNQSRGVICLPTEYARFSQLLRSHAARFGDGYLLRSQEAMGCYESHNHLACCAMCGAAAESILLALAISKKGSQDDILKEYKSANGRSKIENMLIDQQTGPVKQDFTNFMNLLKYWRDESAHGASIAIQEEEAFTSLLLLFRFAQFADSRWNELTT